MSRTSLLANPTPPPPPPPPNKEVMLIFIEKFEESITYQDRHRIQQYCCTQMRCLENYPLPYHSWFPEGNSCMNCQLRPIIPWDSITCVYMLCTYTEITHIEASTSCKLTLGFSMLHPWLQHQMKQLCNVWSYPVRIIQVILGVFNQYSCNLKMFVQAYYLFMSMKRIYTTMLLVYQMIIKKI